MNDFAIKVLTSPLGKTHIFSVGQAGYILKSKSGQLLGIDLYLSECVERLEGHIGFKRLLPKILNPFEVEFDCIIATHPHLDHFDMDSIPAMMSWAGSRLFASVDCKKLIENLEMTDEKTSERTIYVKPGDRYTVGDFKISFVNCDHGEGAPDAVGVIVEVDGKRIYEAGDTCLRLDRTDEYKAFGDIDVMIAPINGAYGNLNADECAELAMALGPKLTIPCHYGMFASHGGDPGRFYEIMKEKKLPFAFMAQGERITLE